MSLVDNLSHAPKPPSFKDMLGTDRFLVIPVCIPDPANPKASIIANAEVALAAGCQVLIVETDGKSLDWTTGLRAITEAKCHLGERLLLGLNATDCADYRALFEIVSEDVDLLWSDAKTHGFKGPVIENLVEQNGLQELRAGRIKNGPANPRRGWSNAFLKSFGLGDETLTIGPDVGESARKLTGECDAIILIGRGEPDDLRTCRNVVQWLAETDGTTRPTHQNLIVAGKVNKLNIVEIRKTKVKGVAVRGSVSADRHTLDPDKLRDLIQTAEEPPKP